MTSNLKRALGFCGWAIVVLGILKSETLLETVIGRSPSICGPWGCGPPVSTLIVWNTFIGSICVPAAILLGKRLGFGRVVAVIVTLICVGWVCYDLTVWHRASTHLEGNYRVQRALFATVAFTDAPVIPGLLSGLAYWWSAKGPKA